ncbi:MAG: molybdopterin cofactor-binding domain-containing protein [Spartobacteria bacterium]
MKTTRRTFLKTAALGGTALVIGFDGRRLCAAGEASAARFQPNGWIRIDAQGGVTLTLGKSEMGQGVRTALPMILADELGADWLRVTVVQAMPGPDFKRLGTGGSGSVQGSWKPLREAGAAAREMLIRAAASRWQVDPSSCSAETGAVHHADSGRSLTFGDLVEEAAKLPIPSAPSLKEAKDFHLVGKRTSRIDGRDQVSGATKFGIDTRVPGMLYASIERPPVFGAKAKGWNEKAARRVRGVRTVVSVTSGVAVVGESTWSALKGRAALAVDWDETKAIRFDSDQHREKLETASRQRGIVLRSEKPASPTEAPARTLDATYFYPFYAHAPLETMNCTAAVQPNECELWAPTQDPNDLQRDAARLLGLALDKVKVHVTTIGGGFGRRLANDYAFEAIEVSRAVKAPVQVLWTRPDDTRHGHFQAASVHRLTGGLGADGKLVRWRHTKAGSLHNLGGVEKPPTPNDAPFYQGYAWGVYDLPYTVVDLEMAYVPVELPVPHGPWRAVFAPGSVFARESFIDELAHARSADPLAFRLDHLQDDAPFQAGDLTIDPRRLRRVLELVRDKSGWDWKQKLAPGNGRGVACNIYDAQTHIAYVVDVAVKDGDVQVKRVVAAVDCGLVINPVGVEQQIEGGVLWGLSSVLKGEITFRNGAAQQQNYGDFEVARMRDAPVIETHIVSSDAGRPFGLGEPPVPPIAPAIVNAIFAATGKRFRKLPIRPADFEA